MSQTADEAGEAPVLVVVVNDPVDLRRARDEGWYRIPLAHAPARVAAEYLAFYQTGAFPAGERWAVRWYAPVRSYRLVSRRELIPGEPDHPRADQVYYRIALGPLEPLERPVPSRRLRRITFIPTTLARLQGAEEINDLWIKSTAQERLWQALKQAGCEAERQYPLREDLPQYVVDFAVLGANGLAGLIVEDEPREGSVMREIAAPDYLLVAGAWRGLRLSRAEIESDPDRWAAHLAHLAA